MFTAILMPPSAIYPRSSTLFESAATFAIVVPVFIRNMLVFPFCSMFFSSTLPSLSINLLTSGTNLLAIFDPNSSAFLPMSLPILSKSLPTLSNPFLMSSKNPKF